MKYIAVIAVALLSFVAAIPISKEPTRQHIQLDKVIVTETKPKASVKPVVSKTVAAPVKTTPVSQPTATHSQPTQTVAQPTPAAQPAPQVVTASYRCEAWASDFDQYNWNPDTAMAICEAESSGNPSAVSNANINPDGIPDYGLMQLHGVAILDPAANIAYAYYHKYLTQGWGAWSTYNSGAYYKYL